MSLQQICVWRPSFLEQVLLAAPVAVALWWFLHAVLAFDQGLDLTDEGLYLLAASHGPRSAGWMAPFGWVTSPLYRVAGGNLVVFRGLGGTILVGLAAGLAVASARTARRDTSNILEGSVIFALGAIGGLLLYAGLLRTPSHYWPHTSGVLIILIALARALRTSQIHSMAVNTFLLAFGLQLVLASRWPVALVAVFVALVCQAVTHNWRSAAKFAALSGASTAVIVVCLRALELIPPAPLSVFRRTMTGPALEQSYTYVGAVYAYLRLPVTAWETAPQLAYAVGFVCAVELAGMGRIFRRPGPRWRRAGNLWAFVAVTFVAGVAFIALLYFSPVLADWLGVMQSRAETSLLGYLAWAMSAWGAVVGLPVGALLLVQLSTRRRRAALAVALSLWSLVQFRLWESTMFGGVGGPQQINPRLVNALLAMLIAALFLAASERNVVPRRLFDRHSAVLLLSLGVLGLSIPAGTDQNLYRMLATASALIVAATVAVISSVTDHRQRLLMLSGNLAVFALIAVAVVSDSREHPFRFEAVSEQNQELCYGTNAHCVLVSQFRSQELSQLLRAADAQGWTAGTPLFAVATPWAATLTWLLEADVPESLMFTLGTLPGEEAHRQADAVFLYNLRRIPAEDWRDGWILITSESPPGDARQVDRWNMDRESSLRRAKWAADFVGMSFPEDYHRVWASSDSEAVHYGRRIGVELWAPRDP